MAEGPREPVPFPQRWIRPLPARLTRTERVATDCLDGATAWDLEVALAPFDVSELLPDADESARTDGTSFQFESICLPAQRIDELEDRSFEFPVNPEPGYVDGSIYLMNAHNPADLRRIDFGAISGGSIPARFVVEIRFEFEQSGLADRTVEFAADILPARGT